MITRISRAQEMEEKVKQAENMLVYFYNDHCAPCLSLRPKIEELVNRRFPLMDLVYVNAEEFPELTASYQAFSFPVLIFIFEGKEFLRYSKYVALSELENSIGRIYDLYHSG